MVQPRTEERPAGRRLNYLQMYLAQSRSRGLRGDLPRQACSENGDMAQTE